MIRRCIKAVATALLTVAVCWICAGSAIAHDPKLASVKVVEQSSATSVSVAVHVSALCAETGVTGQQALEAAMRGRLRLEFDGRLWTPARGRLQIDSANDLAYWQGSHGAAVSRVRLLSPVISKDRGAFTILQVFRDGQPVAEQVVDAQSPPVSRPASPMSSLARFFAEGLHHIAGGFDHLAFVLGLVLVARNTRRAFAAATGFTIAHSLTLATTALGWIAPNSAFVEAMVAGSIALVAAEALWGGKNGQRRLAVHALGFGLVHGMAFASAVSALISDTTSVSVGLIGFNMGVEAGQGLFVLAIAPGMAWLSVRRPGLHERLHGLLGSGIGLAGLWWLGGRLAGLFAG